MDKEEYTELCTEIGSKEEVGILLLFTMKIHHKKACINIEKWTISISLLSQGELEKALKEKVIEKRSTVFEKTKEEVTKRVKFEDAVSVKV